MVTEEVTKQNSEAMGKPPFGSTFGLWEILSLAGAGLLFCFVALGCQCVRKKRDDSPPEEVEEEEGGGGFSTWLSSFWQDEASVDQPSTNSQQPKTKSFFSRSNAQVPRTVARRREVSDEESFSSESYMSNSASFDESVSVGSLSTSSY